MKKNKSLLLLLIVSVLLINMSSVVFADDGATTNMDAKKISARAMDCRRCDKGTMLLSDRRVSDNKITVSSEDCSYYGCIKTKYKQSVVETYRCNYCNFNYTSKGYRYGYDHSIDH